MQSWKTGGSELHEISSLCESRLAVTVFEGCEVPQQWLKHAYFGPALPSTSSSFKRTRLLSVEPTSRILFGKAAVELERLRWHPWLLSHCLSFSTTHRKLASEFVFLGRSKTPTGTFGNNISSSGVSDATKGQYVVKHVSGIKVYKISSF